MTTRRGADMDYTSEGDHEIYDGIVATITETEHAQYLERLRLHV